MGAVCVLKGILSARAPGASAFSSYPTLSCVLASCQKQLTMSLLLLMRSQRLDDAADLSHAHKCTYNVSGLCDVRQAVCFDRSGPRMPWALDVRRRITKIGSSLQEMGTGMAQPQLPVGQRTLALRKAG